MIEKRIYRIRHIKSIAKFCLRNNYFGFIRVSVKLLTTAEAAEKLGVSVRRVRALIREKKLVAQKVGRDYAIEEKALKDVKVYGKAGRPKKQAGKKKEKR